MGETDKLDCILRPGGYMSYEYLKLCFSIQNLEAQKY